MCGICGIIGLEPDKEKISLMNNMMTHRGPDDEGYYFDERGKAQFAMRRLAIIDLETGRQPILNEDGTKSVICNGEIYNFKSFRKYLEDKGHRFKTNSDAEVILHGYEELGESVLDRLDGMFAFAVWNSKEKKLFCGRDRLGIKPFYYCEKNNVFYFASEQKAVLSALPASPELSRKSLMRHFLAGFSTNYGSMFEDIKQLPPGTFLVYENGTSKIKRYWEFGTEKYLNSSEAEKLTREKLWNSVSAHLQSDVPVGLTLSGGLDSSIIANIMSQKTGKDDDRFTAYTVGYGMDNDELPYASLVAEKLGFNHKTRIFSPAESINQLPKILWHLEEPLSNITVFTTWNWAKLIGGERKATLIGEGADELFGGYIYHRIFSGLPALAPNTFKFHLYRKAFLLYTISSIMKMFKNNRDVIEEAKSIANDEIMPYFSGPGASLRNILSYDLDYELANNQLMRIDRLSMAFSLEARVPFLDRDFSEFAWSLPDKYKIKNGSQKNILRKAFSKSLPEQIIKRPKIGKRGSQGITEVLFKSGLEDAFNKAINRKDNFMPEFFDMEYLKKLLAKPSFPYPFIGNKIKLKLSFSILSFFIYYLVFYENSFKNTDEIPSLAEIL